MRILCLHPWGTSGVIFEKQLGTLNDMLGPTHEYVSINGSIPCGPARDLPDFVKGPYYCWYEGLSSPQCQEAHDIITETIEEEGPFDGVIGFSQGASLALSFILHHELHNPGLPSPFRFALFFCSNLVISPDPKFNADKIVKYSRYYKPVDHEMKPVANIDVDEELDDQDRAEAEEKDDKEGRENGTRQTGPAVNGAKLKAAPKHRALLLLPGKKEALVEELVHLVNEMSGNLPGQADASSHLWPKDGTPEDFPRLMHPLTLKARVSIPSVHVIGQGDPLRRHGELAVRLCDKKKTKVVYFNGGHRIPTALPTLRAITTAVEWAMQKGQLM
ncbi:serine hydrolase-domain-containing protein [Chaetomidium leptoderma]|uniref:Serine hydrolase-domain-containing protein n=1 Tax=Chaetomidium leptoderma TaxID=669021 RepID=A0AAN6VPE0_9PEZI|nr:serine hydrolase-domain-containing protein [Chaetomidium leptoderma]